MEGPSPEDLRSRLLAWFDAGHRDLPWRRTKDPYRILLAEYLLQRTRVVSGTPYYERFLERFPDVRSLATASEEEVLRAWEGLGFYRRARHLHAAARAIVDHYGGRVPRDAEVLQSLPGIGAYTAGAVASIAFDARVPAVDGNVARVLARLLRIEEDVSRGVGRRRLQALAAEFVPARRPGKFNQALMELGATVCTPTSPDCPHCPLNEPCLARRAGMQASLPRSTVRRAPRVVPVAFAYLRSGDRVLLVRRPPSGLLGGLWSLPGGELPPGSSGVPALRNLVAEQTGVEIRVGEPAAEVRHTFSHRRWSGAVYRCGARRGSAPVGGARWVPLREIPGLPLVPFHRTFLENMESCPTLESFGRKPRSGPP